MKKLFAMVALVFGITGLLFAADAKSGFLIDAMCGQMSAANAEQVEHHKVACSLMPNCQSSGFGIVADGKFYKFDKDGDKEALDLLKTTKKNRQLEVKVTGEFDGQTIKVEKIEEVE